MLLQMPRPTGTAQRSQNPADARVGDEVDANVQQTEHTPLDLTLQTTLMEDREWKDQIVAQSIGISTPYFASGLRFLWSKRNNLIFVGG